MVKRIPLGRGGQKGRKRNTPAIPNRLPLTEERISMKFIVLRCKQLVSERESRNAKFILLFYDQDRHFRKFYDPFSDTP